MSESIDANSVVFIRVPLVKPLKNGQAYDPTSDVVDLAIIPSTQAKPAIGDWKTAGWEPSNGSGTYWGRLLVGLGTPFGAPTPGTYGVYMRVHDNPETPILTSGFVMFT